MSHGLLMIRGGLSPEPIETKRLIHSVIHYSAMFIAILGLAMMLCTKIFVLQSSTHISSVHEGFGVTTLTLLFLQLPLGWVKYMVLAGRFKFLPLDPHPVIKHAHAVLGGLTYFLGLIAICTAVHHLDSPGPLANACYTLVTLFGIVVLSLFIVGSKLSDSEQKSTVLQQKLLA